jgi:hypothetical protein
MKKNLTLCLALFAAFLAAGCGMQGTSSDTSPTVSAPRAAAEKTPFLLAAEPAGAKGVTDARMDAKDGDDVVVFGRIGGEKKPWVDGRAAFWVVDSAFKACNDKADDDCKTPWDYCCDDPGELHKGMATVKIVDGEGKTIAVDARELLGVKELQTVVVKGKAKRDEQGNLTVLASGVYPRP